MGGRSVPAVTVIVLVSFLASSSTTSAQVPIQSIGFQVVGTDVLRVANRTAGYIPQPPFGAVSEDVSPDGRSELLVETDADAQPSVWLQQGSSKKLVHVRGTYPKFAPTGEWFAVVGPRQTTQKYYYPTSLYIYRLDPLRLERRFNIDVHHYVWSPTGDRLAVSGPIEAQSGPRRPIGIYVTEVFTGRQVLVDSIPWRKDLNTNAWWVPEVPGFSWAPDGQFFVYSRVEQTQFDSVINSELFVARSTGEARQRITDTPLIAELWPRWIARDRILVHRIVFRRRQGTKLFEWDRTEEVRLRLSTPRGMLDLPVFAQPSEDSTTELVLAAASPKPAQADVGIDPGHCGEIDEPGALGVDGAGGLDESDLNLWIAGEGLGGWRWWGLGILTDFGYSSASTRYEEHTDPGNPEPCYTPTQRAEIISGKRANWTGAYWKAYVAVSIHHNSWTTSIPYGTEILKHYLAQSPMPQAIFDNHYNKIAPHYPGCTQKRPVVLVVPGENGWPLLDGLYQSKIPAVLVESAFVSNDCQWNVLLSSYLDQTLPMPYLEDASTGIAQGIATCLNPRQRQFCKPP